MFYIDEYSATAITDKVPDSVKNITRAVPVIKTDEQGKSFDINDAYGYFWYLMGTTIGEHTGTFEKVLRKYNIQASGGDDVVDAVTDLYTTDKWKPFFADVQPLFADTIENMSEIQNAKNEETGYAQIVVAVVAAVGAIASGISSVSSSNKQKKGAEALAKSNAMMGLSNVVAEKQKAQIALEEAKAKERRLLIGGIIAFLLVLIIVVGIIVIRRNKPAEA